MHLYIIENKHNITNIKIGACFLKIIRQLTDFLLISKYQWFKRYSLREDI